MSICKEHIVIEDSEIALNVRHWTYDDRVEWEEKKKEPLSL